MNCSTCGEPITPLPEMTNYDLTLVLFYKSRRCTTCNTNTGEDYGDFLREFADRMDNRGLHSWQAETIQLVLDGDGKALYINKEKE